MFAPSSDLRTTLGLAYEYEPFFQTAVQLTLEESRKRKGPSKRQLQSEEGGDELNIASKEVTKRRKT